MTAYLFRKFIVKINHLEITETKMHGMPDPEDLSSQKDNPNYSKNPDLQAPENEVTENRKPRHKHEDHHVNRKYKLFSNHSSYGDSPHTNTSF